MFNLIQYLIRLFLFLVFVAASPVFLLVAIAFTKSFEEAIEDTIGIVTMPLKKETFE